MESGFEWWTNYLETGKKAALIVGIATFLAAYAYCVVTYGFLLGMGFGWLPSLILAAIIGVASIFLWLPLMGMALVVGFYLMANMSGVDVYAIEKARQFLGAFSVHIAMSGVAILCFVILRIFLAIVKNFR